MTIYRRGRRLLRLQRLKRRFRWRHLQFYLVSPLKINSCWHFKKKPLTQLLENIRSLHLAPVLARDLKNEIQFYRDTENALDGIHIDYEKMGILDTINCGRWIEAKDFWKPDLIKANESKLITGIVSGPLNQNPGSLAERLVFEFLEEIDSDDQAVWYQRNGGTGRMRPLIIDCNTQVLLHNAIDEYLETLADHRELSQYYAIAHLIEIDVEATKNVLYNVFDVIHQRLQSFSEESKVFNLCLLSYSHSSSLDTAKLNHHLLKIAEERLHVKYYRITSNVKIQEITNWFKDNGATHVKDIRRYLQHFVEFRSSEEVLNTFEQKQTLPMQIMEKIQRQLFKYVMSEKSENNSLDHVS